MKVYETKDIRNIALIGGAKSGKTTLAESMLFEGKLINRKGAVEDRNTMSDYRQIELEKEHSVHSTFLHTINNNTKIAIVVRQWLIRGVVGIGRPNNTDLF